MAKKRIFTVGFDLPGDEFEYIPFNSNQSLLDADIILFEPSFGDHRPEEDYQGKPLFSPYASHRVHESLNHWRAELAGAVNAGKLVIIFLTTPLIYYRYTGHQTFSGTGRSRVTTNIVNEMSNYSAVPNVSNVEAKTGRAVRLTKKAEYLKAYWKEVAQYSAYEAFIEGKFTHTLIVTKTAEKIVGAAIYGKGSLLYLPPIRYDEGKFTKFDPKTKKTYWSEEGIRFGKRLLAALVALSGSVLSGRVATPPPAWVLDSAFATTQELELQVKISKVSNDISELQQQRVVLEQELADAGAIRALLYEQGKPLEQAVLEALRVLDFSATPFADGDSEFDAVFFSPEGRFIGEVEGKDEKPVNIDKLSQLERNLHEDFAREEVTDYAKGVLFGNTERLKPPKERGQTFTEKCLTGAKRARIALVRTHDLFESVLYLRKFSDAAYAKSCREAVFSTDGEIVVFPTPPVSSESNIGETEPEAE